MRFFLTALLLLSATPSVAQFVTTPSDARSCGMGGCLPVQSEHKYVTVSYRQGFAMAGMATRRLGAGWTLGANGWMAADYAFFGDQSYAEQQATAMGGMAINESVGLEVEGRYCRLGTDDGHYESDDWISVAARVTLRLGSHMQMSALAGTRPWDQARPWRMHLNTTFVPSSGLLAVLELESEELLRFRCGAEYSYREHFFFRAGMATHPMALTFGMGVRYESYIIDLAAETHNTLGITPQISLTLWL